MQGLAAVLPEGAWRALLDAGRERRFDSGELLLRQGDEGAFVLLLSVGRVKITRVESDGRRLLLAVRGPGEALGELSAWDGSSRTATVAALGPCLAHALPAHRFCQLVRQYAPDEVLLRHVFARLREGEDIRADLAHLGAGQRLARILLRLAATVGSVGGTSSSLDLGLSQEELGLAAGLSRSAVAAELGRFRDRGLVSTGRRRVVLLDVFGLRRLADEVPD
jgi:CRP/FNR family transcriptional regulator, cyclic AMP receptor protein